MSAESSPSIFESAMPDNKGIIEAADYLANATYTYFRFCQKFADNPGELMQERLINSCESYTDAIIGYFRAIQHDGDTSAVAFVRECQRIIVSMDDRRVTELNAILGGTYLTALPEEAGQAVDDVHVNTLDMPEDEFKEYACIQLANDAMDLAAQDTKIFIQNVV